jgi:hypothetical protein
MVLVKTYQRSKLFLVLLDERPHEKSWGFLFYQVDVTLHLHLCADLVMLFRTDNRELFPDHPNLLFRTNHAIQIPGWDDRWITDCWSVIHAKQYKTLWTDGSG